MSTVGRLHPLALHYHTLLIALAACTSSTAVLWGAFPPNRRSRCDRRIGAPHTAAGEPACWCAASIARCWGRPWPRHGGVVPTCSCRLGLRDVVRVAVCLPRLGLDEVVHTIRDPRVCRVYVRLDVVCASFVVSTMRHIALHACLQAQNVLPCPAN